MNAQDYVGQRSASGVTYPRLTIHGAKYDRVEVSTVDIGYGHFVVVGSSERLDKDRIEEIKTSFRKEDQEVKRKPERAEGNVTDNPVGKS
jgi:transposase